MSPTPVSALPSAHTRHRLRAALSLTTAVALAVGGVLVAPMAASAAGGQVSGTVFRDFNQNGRFDSGNSATSGKANDVGLSGVTVTAVDGAGDVVGTGTTDALGAYTITVTDAASTALRIEFSGWDPAYQPSGTSATVSAGGTGTNGTSVQFTSIGATGVDFALNAPGDFSQDQAPILTAIQRAGSPIQGGAVGQSSGRGAIDAPAVTAVGYHSGRTGTQGGTADMVTLATFGEVGAVDGLVYRPQSNTAYAFASYKRMSGLGPLGLGGIYRISDVMVAGSPSAAGAVEPWLDVTTLGIDLGDADTNAERGLRGPQDPVADADAFAKAGKVGFGGVTLSPDGNTLYFVNLHDKKLYAIDMSGPGVPTEYESYPLGLGADERPWAVSIYRGVVYVGYVDSGESGQPGRSAASAGLRAHVLAASLDADGEPGVFTEVLDADLGYEKGDVYGNQLVPQSHRWNTWTDTWAWDNGDGDTGRVAANGGGWHIYPQPLLTSLYIDEGGYLTLGLRDRTSIQGGNRGIGADGSGGNYETGASGDLLIASPDGDGTFTLESAGVALDRTGSGATGNGPGGHEFYNDRQNIGTGTSHNEVALGAVLGLRGSGTVVSTAYDPLAGIRLSGLAWYDIDDGAAVAGYELTVDGSSGPSADGGFQKGGGLGAVTLLADESPVEIGNRVWFDADRDGIQDADEPNVQGVRVELWSADGTTMFADTVTDASGTYFFRSDEDGFDTEGDYVVRFVKPETGTATLTGPNSTAFGPLDWGDIDFTAQNTGGTTVDSDADPTTGKVTVTVHGPGMNRHDIDAGLVADTTFQVQKLIDASGGAAVPGQTFVIDIAARDFRGDALTISPTQVTLAAGATSALMTVPVGARIKVSESDPNLKDVDVVGPGTADADGYYALPSSTGGYLLQVTNTLFTPGTFRVTKAVSGDFDLGDPELADAVFTVNYSYAGGTGQLVLDADNSWTASPTGLFAYGTEVTLTEATPTGAAASVEFGDPSWSAGDADADGSAVITIGDGTTTALTLTNPTTALSGTFQVTKEVTGPAATLVDGDPQYAVDYTSAAGNGRLLVRDGQTVPGPVLPTGTVVTLTEVTPAGSLLPSGAAWGVPRLTVDGTAQANGSTFVIGDDTTVAIVVENPTSTTPGVEIHKGDGDADAGTITHEADTVADGEVYAVGETRDIVIRVTNTGPEPLREVELADTLTAGGAIEDLVFTFPDGSTTTAAFDAATGTWSADWAATFAPGTAEWAPGDVIVGTATLTIAAGDGAHQDRVRVDAVSTLSGTPVDDENDYNAFTAGIQVIKYDGEKTDPVVRDGADWIVPAKPLADADQDADDTDHAVPYTAGVAQTVRWVVTNTGDTWLTDIDLRDVTDAGPAIGAWTADLSAFGGPADYDFVADGTWHGLLPPGASFFAEGELTLGADAHHADTVTVEGTPVVPDEDADGEPTDTPRLDDGEPVRALDDGGRPIRLRDADPFHAVTPAPHALAGTGVDEAAWSAAGAALLLLGGGLALLLTARRRRAAHRS